MLSLEQSGRLVARALGVSSKELEAGLVRVDEASLPEVRALRQKVLGAEITWDDERYLRWRYSFADDAFKCASLWQFRRGGALCGLVGIELIDLWILGEYVQAGCVIDLTVHPDVEGIGLGVWLVLSMLEECGTLLTVGGNANSRRMTDRLLRPLAPRREYLFPIRSSHALSRSRRLKAFRTLGSTLDLSAEVVRRILKPRALADVELRTIERFDAEVDVLSRRYAHSAGSGVDRNHARMNWRYIDNPRARYVAIGAYIRGVLEGYLVYRRSRSENGLEEAWIVDFLCGEVRTDALRYKMIDSAIAMARSSAASVLRVAGFDQEWAVALKRQGFIEASRSERKLAANSTNLGVLKAIADPAFARHVTDFLSDDDGC